MNPVREPHLFGMSKSDLRRPSYVEYSYSGATLRCALSKKRGPEVPFQKNIKGKT